MKRCKWLIISCLLASGCGGVADVKGTVSYKGNPLKFGSVTAVSAAGTHQSLIGADGTYTLTEVPTGKAKFYVYCQDPKTVDLVKELAAKAKSVGAPQEGAKAGGGRIPGKLVAGGGGVEATKALANPNMIPEKYSDMTKELLTYTVVRGANTYDIKLE